MKWKWQKILHEFSTFQKYSKYWSVLLEHFIKHKPFISKRVTFLKNVLNCGSQAILWQKEFEDWIVWRLHAFNIVITTYVFQVFSLIFKQQENNSLCCSNCNFLHNIQKLELNIYDAYHCTENLRISCMKQKKSTENLLLWYQNYSVENKNNSSYYAERAFISLIFNW